jgi:hypothetical protein
VQPVKKQKKFGSTENKNFPTKWMGTDATMDIVSKIDSGTDTDADLDTCIDSCAASITDPNETFVPSSTFFSVHEQ